MVAIVLNIDRHRNTLTFATLNPNESASEAVQFNEVIFPLAECAESVRWKGSSSSNGHPKGNADVPAATAMQQHCNGQDVQMGAHTPSWR
jgi:hypothetical protein